MNHLTQRSLFIAFVTVCLAVILQSRIDNIFVLMGILVVANICMSLAAPFVEHALYAWFKK